MIYGVIAVVFTLALALLCLVPRPITLLVFTSIVGGIAGLFVLLPHSSTVICDYFRPIAVDTCSGTYVGDWRLPQFMQGRFADAWLLGLAALAGAVAVDLVTLALMLLWFRVKRGARPSSSTYVGKKTGAVEG